MNDDMKKQLRAINTVYEIYRAYESGQGKEAYGCLAQSKIKDYIKKYFLYCGMKGKKIVFSARWDKNNDFFYTYLLGRKLLAWQENAEAALKFELRTDIIDDMRGDSAN